MGRPGQPRCLRLIRPAPGDHPPTAAADGADPLRVLPDPRVGPSPDLGPDESPRKELAKRQTSPRRDRLYRALLGDLIDSPGLAEAAELAREADRRAMP